MSKFDYCLNLFLQDLQKYKQLLPEETLALVKKYKETSDENCLNEVILGNIRLIISKAKRYKTNRISISDLIYAGMLGIAKAAKKFDVNRKIRFTTYASYWIEMYMRRECIYSSSIVKRSPRGWDLSRKMARLQLEGASEKEILNALKIRRKTLRNIRKINCDISLNTIFSDESEKKTRELNEIILVDEQTPSDICASNDLSDFLYEVIDSLKERERKVIYTRFGLKGYNPLNMRQIGRYLHVTPERVRQILNATLKKLKKYLKKEIPSSH